MGAEVRWGGEMAGGRAGMGLNCIEDEIGG